VAKNSEARIRANNKYNLKAYDTVQLRVKKGERERLQRYVISRETSINGFFNSCASYCIEHDIDVTEAKPLGEVLPQSETENQSEGE